MYKCYIYGAGMEYQKLASYLPIYQEKMEILGIVTTKKQPFKFLDGIPCIQPKEMLIEEMDYVIIAVQKWREIYDYLKAMGIKDNKILRGHIFGLPNFNLEEYLKLKKSNISILSNSCIGGILYRTLGMKTLSPTINAACHEDYIEFFKHYRKYLNMDMVVQNSRKDVFDLRTFRPQGVLDNKVTWYFPHNGTGKEGVESWNVKRKQVNYENIAVIAIIYTDKDAEEFERLEIEKKLGFYYKDLHLKSVIPYTEWIDNQELRFQYKFAWNEYVFASLNRINWINFLNNGNDFLRYM